MSKRLSLLGYTSLITIVILGAGCAKPTNQVATTGEEETDSFSTTDIVSEDAYGKDLQMLERYPNSLRSYYTNTVGDEDVTYQTNDSVEDVRSFYDAKLQAAGWKLTQEATDAMEYEKGDSDNPEMLGIYFSEFKSQRLVEYTLSHVQPLSDEELTELELDEASF